MTGANCMTISFSTPELDKCFKTEISGPCSDCPQFHPNSTKSACDANGFFLGTVFLPSYSKVLNARLDSTVNYGVVGIAWARFAEALTAPRVGNHLLSTRVA